MTLILSLTLSFALHFTMLLGWLRFLAKVKFSSAIPIAVVAGVLLTTTGYIHELGHALAAKITGLQVIAISGTWQGLRLETYPHPALASPIQQIVVSIAGPLASYVMYATAAAAIKRSTNSIAAAILLCFITILGLNATTILVPGAGDAATLWQGLLKLAKIPINVSCALGLGVLYFHISHLLTLLKKTISKFMFNGAE